MKLFALIGVLICVPAFAQPDGWVQEDCGEGHIVICKKKKKVGIWSNARGEFIEPAHKGHVLHFPEAQIILDVYPKEKEVKTYHYFKGGIQELETPYPTGKFAFCNIVGDEWNQKFEVKNDGYFFHYEDHDESDSAVYVGISPVKDDHEFEDSLSFYFLNDYLIVKLSHENYVNQNPKGLLTIDNMDSLDENYNLVYEPQVPKKIFNSGVFNLKTGKWDIPPKYVRVVEWNDLYAGYQWIFEPNGELDSIRKTSYDFYQNIQKEGIVKTSFMNYRKFAFPLELWPIEDEKVWYDSDSTMIFHQNEKGTGLYHIPLTYKKTDPDGYSLNYNEVRGVYRVEEILKPQYEYAFLTGYKHQYDFPASSSLLAFGSKGNDIFDIRLIDYWKTAVDTLFKDVQMKFGIEPGTAFYSKSSDDYYDETVYLVDDTTILRYQSYETGGELYEIKDWVYTKSVNESFFTFHVDRAPNDQFVVNSWYEEDTYYPPALKSVIDDYDSIDVNGNVVYGYNEAGLYNSGVFDGKSNSWVVPEKNIFVSYVKDGYLIESPVFVEDENAFMNFKGSVLSFVDAQGNYIFKSKDARELFDKWENNVYRIQGFNAKKTWPVDTTREYTVYFETDEGIGCATIKHLNSNIHLAPKDMVIYVYNHILLYADNKELTLRFEGYKGKDGDTVEFQIPRIPELKLQVNGPGRASRFRNDIDFSNPESEAYGPNDHRCYILLNDSLGCHYMTTQKINDRVSFDTLNYKIPNVKKEKIWTTFRSDKMYDNWELNIEFIDEDRVYIRNRKQDDDYLVAVKSQIDFYMDSIDAYGNVVYYPPEAGYEASGVYNIETNQWEIEPKYMQIASISGDNYLLKESIRGEYNILKGYKTILKQGDQENILHEENINGMSDEKFTVGILNDSLVIINHYKIYEPEKPYMSLIYGDDSLDADGNTVFAPASPAINNSGVYNVYTNEWAISPQNEWIYTFKNTFIVETPVLGENGRKSMVFYHIYDKDGKSLQVGLSYDELSPEQQERITAKY